MNQKLSDWASIAEIASGLAVVITLVFLLVGIKDNTNATRATAYQLSTADINEWRMWTASDPDRLRIYQAAFVASEANDLTDSELVVLAWTVGAQFGIYESRFYLNEYESLGQAEWERTLSAACYFYTRLVELDIWEARTGIMAVRPMLTDEFAGYLASSCS